MVSLVSLVSVCLGVDGGRLPSESGREGEEVAEAARSSGAGRGGSRGTWVSDNMSGCV